MKAHVAALVIPFHYDMPFPDAAEAVNADRFEKAEPAADRCFEHIRTLVAHASEPHTIGRMWKMTQRGRHAYGLPNNHRSTLTCNSKAGTWTFAVTNVELYLFETGTGFLVHHIEFSGAADARSFTEGLYALKKIAGYGNTIRYERRLSKTEAEMQSFSFAAAASEAVEPFAGRFFDGNGSTPAEAIVFSGALLDVNTKEAGAEEFAADVLFRLRRAYREAYKPVSAHRSEERDEFVIRPFENSRFGVSLEGMANVVTRTGDPETDAFFEGAYFHQLKGTYLYLYILALHQKYALVRLSKLAAGLQGELGGSRGSLRAQSDAIDALKQSCIRFMLRSSYHQVTYNTHHSDVYELIRRRLRIEELMLEINESLHALAALTAIVEQALERKEEAAKREREEAFHRKITWITALFLPLTVVCGLFGMELDLIQKASGSVWPFLVVSLVAYSLTYLLFRVRFRAGTDA
ncbi:CorA family divalent cation transporter [Paenibacillus sp.]|uniref:CorA family divalent cation transporter n=1 Tax=Paenibacillus sp. TaxID=58172 RepID=UPI002D243EE0|nr:CorA family divalent cation transporter [Paenibacillus sp.]HZG86000.1 CorA family divalent cation transporter [Paenibacillus sp.]